MAPIADVAAAIDRVLAGLNNGLEARQDGQTRHNAHQIELARPTPGPKSPSGAGKAVLILRGIRARNGASRGWAPKVRRKQTRLEVDERI